MTIINTNRFKQKVLSYLSSFLNIELDVNAVNFLTDKSSYNFDKPIKINDAYFFLLDSEKDLYRIYDTAIALSDETTDLSVDNDANFPVASRAEQITGFLFSVNTAPAGSSILVDILKNGTTILSAQIELVAGSTYVQITDSVITDTAIAVGDLLRAEIVQVGATTAGAGAKIIKKSITV